MAVTNELHKDKITSLEIIEKTKVAQFRNITCN